jgi:protein BUR2
MNAQNIAATALFLATKAEENCRKTKEIVIAVVKVAQKNASLIIDEQSKEFWRWKDSILLYEETMLELLTFDVVLESPYNCLYNALKILGMESNKNMRNVSWSFVNDSIMTHLCLLLPPKDIAVAAIYFAAQFTHEAIPDVDGGAWWERLRGRPERIEQAVDVMTEFFTDNPLKKSDNPYEKEGSEKSFDEELEGTRLRTGSQSVSPNGGEGEEHRAEDIPWGGDDGHGNGNEVDGAEGRSPPKDTVPDATVPPTSSTNGKGENHLQSQLSLAAASTSAATPGDDDTTLKALANDPATHEHHDSGAHHDGAAAAAAAASTTSDAATAERATAAPAPRPLANGFGAESPRKRKGSEDVHVMAIDAVITDSHADADADTNEPEAKRLRTEDPAGTGTGTESEEGEVEE